MIIIMTTAIEMASYNMVSHIVQEPSEQEAMVNVSPPSNSHDFINQSIFIKICRLHILHFI